MLGSGAVVVIGEQTDLLAAATNVLRFFRNESCGKCVPCRVGLPQGARHLDRGTGPGRRRRRDHAAHRRARGDSADDLDLRARPGRARAGDERVAPPADPGAKLTPDGCHRARILHGQDRGPGAGRVSPAPPQRRRDGDAGRRPPAECRSTRSTRGEPLPGFDRSSVDGFAVRAQDTFGATDAIPAYLQVDRAVRMGAAADATVGAETAVAVPTGGMLPAGADAVVMIEHTQEAMPGTIEVTRPVAPGEGIVRGDEDLAPGATIVGPGRPLRAQDVAMLAACGIVELAVHARPRVSIIATGDEIVAPETASLPAGHVRDALSVSIGALVAEAGGRAARVSDRPRRPRALCRTRCGGPRATAT